MSRSNYWTSWQPSSDQPWNIQRVVHLHRRAGFAATWSEVQRDLNDRPDSSIRRLLDGKSRIDGVPLDFEQMSQVIADAAVGSNNPNRLKAWWLYRMLFTPDPLTERLTLMWHNHFATSNLKVDDLSLMRRQNETIRQHARATFGELLTALVHDPALLIWLDAPSNRKGHANENLARELMELFTLGIGNYDEKDVKEAARALTGWSVTKGRFENKPVVHDQGQKTILGMNGPFNGDHLVAILLDHPATARRLAWRICDTLMGEHAVDASAIDDLADGIRKHDLDIRWGIETVLRSEAFFAEKNIGSRVSDPAGFVVGAVRAIEVFNPPPSTLVLAEWSARLGQDLFYPPNVGGWTGGRSWLNSRAIVGRANFAASLVDGKFNAPAAPPALWKVAARHARGGNLSAAMGLFSQLLLGTENNDTLREIESEVEGLRESNEEKLRLAVALILARPEAYLV